MDSLEIKLLIFLGIIVMLFIFVVRTNKARIDEERREENEFDEWWLENPEFHPRGRSFEEFYWSRQDAREQWKKL
ncbi:MAG: hypothetical protein A3I88_02200 [Candidatus Portnoybacteria bacterium RIFCSPLOWO2_12_FULL_39_9]|uniref:Uncharacterized protein n=1 Tax=Candidatus Portnoybacteria bacterium RIFCSPHIGHO2_12_FULL_38_9 TaxID=1801997 RepID=A0A1G2FEM9_9BACT|nr:MAG: hypothetical protein A3H00_00920 [Candidatus Portnoybacteria bacterium RBG_13_40_8]OGZ36503.1 MAG: hypothetical protein A3J64_02665 [Candidatus Portnoybacteria bacterium RIFCSPHIGHO2_12_FULL_38_9]OGZ37070.1 MAG: hypothetical protein A2646_00645 [Candidatus Portnoybacteria bacterium RIFCSPHIGHO2_02_FULL_39_12]OGZ39504.1 MAG: hypothetical protein A3F21_03570 [Candidatus Portnoybacteria bacterium RIFCSPLOWO2_01_FULL_38_39]OGZ41309.1 MAG: hypothetical protein A3I88_02200 [Candidatus Portnoy